MDQSDNYAVSSQELLQFFEQFIKLYYHAAEVAFLLRRRALPRGAATAELDKQIVNAFHTSIDIRSRKVSESKNSMPWIQAIQLKLV